uniref:Nicastrin n=1 Tax=Culicoides sonorensis TaxID=179676 RepID=A0A336KLF8_CULSO
MHFHLCIIIGLVNFVVLGNSLRTKDKIYTKFGGSSGVLHLLRSDADLKFLLEKPPSPPYIPVIVPRMFTRENILKLKDLGTSVINGIILINDRTSLDTFSHESRCPNQYGGLLLKQTCDVDDPQNSWNPFGTDLMNVDFDFPIFYVFQDGEIKKLVNCTEKFNNFDMENQHYRSLCSVEINSLMSAAGSTATCMRRSDLVRNLVPTKYCDPLKGYNVYGTLFEREQVDDDDHASDPSEKFILVTTRTDTSSLFDGFYRGAMSSLVPFATLMGVAQYLNAVLPKRIDRNNSNVLFVFFNGESFDYIGSQRFVFDMQRNVFPANKTHQRQINMENIELMIDIGTLDDLRTLNVYHPSEFSAADKFRETINAYNSAHRFGITAIDKFQANLPPFSAQSFLRVNESFPAMILTGEPKNRFYQSIYDDAQNLNFTYMNRSSELDFMELENITLPGQDNVQYKIRNMSTLIGMVLYDFITGEELPSEFVNMGVNVDFVDEFLHCFLVTSNCTLFRMLSDDTNLPEYPPIRYIGVNTGNEAFLWTREITGFVLGKKVEKSEDECKYLPYRWYSGVNGSGECKLTTHNYTEAISPAFLIPEYDWTSNNYSTWTESTWSEISARMYLRPSTSHEAFSFATGFIVMLISFVLVFLINSRSDVLFADSTSTTPIAPPASC